MACRSTDSSFLRVWLVPSSRISGNVTIETGFYDGDSLVSKSLVRVYYDA